MTYDERRLETIRLQNELAKEKRKWQNQNLKDYILFAFIGAFIITICIYALNLQLGQAVNKCSQKYDKNYCIKKLR